MMESSGQRYGVRKESPSPRGKIYFLQTTLIRRKRAFLKKKLNDSTFGVAKVES
jgi:hypothetical protein